MKTDKRNDPERPVLVMTFGAKGVGDHVSCTSFVRNLARNRPDAAIDVGVFSTLGAEIFRHDPHVRHIHLLDMNHLKIGGPRSLREKVGFLRRFRAMGYDTVYVLGTKFRHALFAYLTGARNRVGYANHHRGFLLTKTAGEPLQKNLVERFLDLLVLDGMEVTDPWITLHLSEAEKNAVDTLYAEKGMRPGDRVISLAPFAADMRRTWGMQRFWQVARHFANHGWIVLVLGAPHDRSVLKTDPPPDLRGIIDLVGRLSILETAAVIQRSALFLGNDSGLGHIAGAVGTRTVIIGYHITREWYPFAPTVTTIIRDSCSACRVGDCWDRSGGDPECFAAVTVEEVIRELEGMLHRTSLPDERPVTEDPHHRRGARG